MVIVMNPRRRTFWLAPLLISTLLPAGVCAASLAEVKSVYLFPMANGLDQYLAHRLTHDHIFQVVTDPKAADAVITDRLGEGFERALLKVRPELVPPPPPKPVKAKKDGDKNKDSDADSDKSDEDKKDQQDMIVPESSFRSAKGTVFLVHARTQQVLWSGYEEPGGHSSKDMERTAGKIAKLLQLELAPPAAK